MAFHRLTRREFANIQLVDGVARHKFITLPNRIFFGCNKESHADLVSYWERLAKQEPRILERQKELITERALKPCGAHPRAQEVAMIDAGLMVVEGIQVPETVAFTGLSQEYGEGHREITHMLAEIALGGDWKLHL